MHTLISTLVVTATFSVCVSACARAQTPAEPQASPTLTWNQIARETAERMRPTQHQAARMLAYLSLAQYAALADTRYKTLSPDRRRPRCA
jgi:hypothetical protein